MVVNGGGAVQHFFYVRFVLSFSVFAACDFAHNYNHSVGSVVAVWKLLMC